MTTFIIGFVCGAVTMALLPKAYRWLRDMVQKIKAKVI